MIYQFWSTPSMSEATYSSASKIPNSYSAGHRVVRSRSLKMKSASFSLAHVSYAAFSSQSLSEALCTGETTKKADIAPQHPSYAFVHRANDFSNGLYEPSLAQACEHNERGKWI
jgi:hypothetical protein